VGMQRPELSGALVGYNIKHLPLTR
jgi:hypothetical protein